MRPHRFSFLAIGLLLSAAAGLARSEAKTAMELKNDFVIWKIDTDGRSFQFTDKSSGKSYCAQADTPFARLSKGGRGYDVTGASAKGSRLELNFGDSGVQAVLEAKAEKRCLTFEVLSVTGEGVDELAFANLDLSLKGDRDEPFAACALALNLKTNVSELPRASSRLRALCYPRFGFEGAKVAIVACPPNELRAVMQEVVTASPDLPHSSIGGPWALNGKLNRGSYLFNFDGVSEANVDDWIRLAKSLGINQIDFHGGSSFRFGDCMPNPAVYPDGRASLKRVIDKLHAAGIAAGLHTYAFFIDPKCPWVTPVPDPRLGKDACFTLASALSSDAATVQVVEPTEKMSATTGFFVRNSVTLQVDDELITYSGVSKEPPYSFTGCKRGAFGTKPSAHEAGAKVYHLSQCFFLFAPDGDSTLLEEVAAKTADTFNECGFDMIYLDALDGEDVLGGPENSWHYGSKFVFEIWKRLNRPALQEMSTFHHHLWYVRSRMGAWDHPSRSHKKFIDIHCKSNENNERMFLPGHLGWWALKPIASPDTERTFTDDIEYLCAKAAGTECGLSIMGVDPTSIQTNSALASLGAIVKQWEDLRNAGFFTQSVKSKLREPGHDFTLLRDSQGDPRICPADYSMHKFESLDDRTSGWTVKNRFSAQPPQIRIEALWTAAPYDSSDAIILSDFKDVEEFNERRTSSGVTARLESSTTQVKAGAVSALYCAKGAGESVAGGSAAKFSPTEHGVRSPIQGVWSHYGKPFSPAINLGERKAIGVWINGDGQGQVLNLQVRSPENVTGGIADHYVPIDFKGWRYFELIEPEGARSENYGWPYAGNVYAMYRELVNYSQVGSFGLWYANLPAGREVTCYLSPVKALAVKANTLHNPKLAINGTAIEFPADIPSGGYLELRSASDCKLYAPDGSFVANVTPRGTVPELRSGENKVIFDCEGLPGLSRRAKVTVISRGEPIH